MSKHTPGPWINDGDGIVWSESDPIYGWIADCRNGAQDANARLIAAAPDLLEALRSMLSEFSVMASPATAGEIAACEAARAAIAKAEGQ